MMGALIVPMPESCSECQYCGWVKDTKKPACVIAEGYFLANEDIHKERSAICPLKPVPKKFSNTSGDPFTRGYAAGMNKCIDKLLGETK